MAWEWSHSEEAYNNARENLNNIPLSELLIIWGEIQASGVNEWEKIGHATAFDQDVYETTINGGPYTCQDLVKKIWDHMKNKNKTCDNGGFNAWACPYGCHTVSFDPERR